MGFHAAGSARAARRIKTPPEFAAAYGEMLRVLPTLTPPKLEFFDDLHGVGGLFIPSEWVIAIGWADAQVIVSELFRAHGVGALQSVVQELAARRGVVVRDTRTVILGAVVGRIMAHELGHAMQASGWSDPFDDAEASSDFYAAKIDAARNVDPRLGEAIFHAIGCIGASCTHPSPDARAHAYVTGYQDQLSR